MTLTPTQEYCLQAMVAGGGVLADDQFCDAIEGLRVLGISRKTADSLIALGLAHVTERTDHHTLIEPTEAGRAEARRLEEEKTT